MPDWTLLHDSEEHTLREWGFQNCAIKEQSLSTGIFSATVPGYMTATLPFAYRDQVRLKYGGVTKFIGVTMPMLRQGEGVNESITLRFGDPWWWLNQATYKQAWWDATALSSYLSANVALFAEVTAGTGWARRTVAAEITGLIAHCNTWFGGNVMQLGSLLGDGFDAQPVPQRGASLSHEAALRKVLAWVPDAIQQWVYSEDPTVAPTLNFVQRGAATARTYSFAEGVKLTSQTLTRRDDLVVNGVIIQYTGINADGSFVGYTDSAGATTGVGVVQTSVDLTGGAGGGGIQAPNVTPAMQQEYSVESEEYDASDPNFWFKYGNTGAPNAGCITVESGANVSNDNGCGLVWISGGIPKRRIAASTSLAIVQANLRLTTELSDDGEGATSSIVERRAMRMELPVTTLNGDYTLNIQDQIVNMPGGAAGQLLVLVAGGLAAKLLAAWSTPKYEGSLEITNLECTEAVKLGDVVNITGGLDEWSTMATPVVSLNRKLDTGTTEIELGVAQHLSLGEITELFKIGQLKAALDMEQQSKGDTPTGSPGTSSIPELVYPAGIVCSTLAVQAKNVYNFNGQYLYSVDLTS